MRALEALHQPLQLYRHSELSKLSLAEITSGTSAPLLVFSIDTVSLPHKRAIISAGSNVKKIASITLLTIFLSLTLVAENGKGNNGNGNGNGGNFGDGPEIDPASGVSALALLGSAVLVIRGRRAKQ